MTTHDAAVVTLDGDDTVHCGGAVAIEGDRIAAVGPAGDLRARYPTAELVNAAGKAVMPGFANVHTHLFLTIARGIYEDLSPPNRPPFTGGLSPIPLPSLSPEEVEVMVRLGALEALRGPCSGWPVALCTTCDIVAIPRRDPFMNSATIDALTLASRKLPLAVEEFQRFPARRGGDR